MAKERIEIPVTPERTKPENVKLRKSTGKTSTSSSGEKVILPHYLRASTGSCHDFCKYGRKHAFEAEGKHRIWKGITAIPADSDDSVNSATPVERKEKPVVKVRLSPDPKTQFPDKSKIIKREVSSPAKKIEVSAKEVVSFAKKSDVTAKPATSGKPKSATAKPSSSPLNLSGGLGAKRNSNVKMVKNSGTSKIGQKKALIPPIASVSPKPSVSRVSSLNTRKHTNQKVVSPLKNQTKVKKTEPKLSNQYKVIEKTLYVIEQTENKSLEPAQNGSHTTPMSPSLSSSPSSPLLSSHLANEESKSTHSKEENESESTLSEEENDGSEFIVSEEENDESEYTLSEAEDSVSEHDEAENTNQVECLNVENQRPGDAMVHTEDKDCPPQKLNFRRGKVVNLESENNGPRRLRFRQARLLGENQNGKGNVGRRSFRRRREVADGDQKAESEKVVLRHQDVDGKKDAQGLFNNVIEETASKLVETRKSKVKALVGAFETVISLQES